MKLVIFVYIILPLIIFSIAGVALYYRVTGDIQVCKVFYKEMSLGQCYFSSKTVRVPEGK